MKAQKPHWEVEAGRAEALRRSLASIKGTHVEGALSLRKGGRCGSAPRLHVVAGFSNSFSGGFI